VEAERCGGERCGGEEVWSGCELCSSGAKRSEVKRKKKRVAPFFRGRTSLLAAVLALVVEKAPSKETNKQTPRFSFSLEEMLKRSEPKGRNSGRAHRLIPVTNNATESESHPPSFRRPFAFG